MKLAIAIRYALQIHAWLEPYIERGVIAGSIRRSRPEVNDIDLVVIPRVTVNRDMLGAVIGRQNHCFTFLHNYVRARNSYNVKIDSLPHIKSGGETEGKQLILWLPKIQMQIDIWFATEASFATRLLCRTGSREHNIWLCERALAMGYKWHPYNGLFDATGALIPATKEEDIYAALKLPFVDPVRRERNVMEPNFGQPQSRPAEAPCS